MRPPVAIILVNWNGWRDTIECLDSLLAQDYPDFHVFVVDNASSDDSLRHIADWCVAPTAQASWRTEPGVPAVSERGERIGWRSASLGALPLPPPPRDCRLTLLDSGANLGFAGGCNVGLAAAGLERFDYFWLLNTDTVVHRHALDHLVQRAFLDARIGMVGSTLRYYDRPDIVQAFGGARLDQRNAVSQLIGTGESVEQLPSSVAKIEAQLSYIMGASMLVSRRFVADVGHMEPSYFLYYEEVDWAWRGKDRFLLAWARDSHVFHKSGASSSKVLPLTSTRYYYSSRMRFARRFMPQRVGAVRKGLLLESLRHFLHARWPHARAAATAAFASSTHS